MAIWTWRQRMCSAKSENSYPQNLEARLAAEKIQRKQYTDAIAQSADPATNHERELAFIALMVPLD